MAWQIDNSHSQIQFSVRHMMVSKVRGTFEGFGGTIDFNEADPTASTVDISIEAASINTRHEQRDGHLKSPDFLNVAEYPSITFKGTAFSKTSETTGTITGDLTIQSVTKPVTLDVEYSGIAKSPWGTFSAGFSAHTRINRKDWGLGWNVALETGGILVGEDIDIDIELEIVKQPDAE